jgi:hypothetical protein
MAFSATATTKGNVSLLSNNEQNGDFTHVVVFDYTDITNIGDTNQKTIAQIPAGGAVEMVGVYEATALAGATNIVLDVGTTSADPDEFIDALDVDGMSAPVFNTGDAFTGNQSQPVGGTNTATDILAEWNGSTGALTAGEVVIGLRIVDLGRFASGTQG